MSRILPVPLLMNVDNDFKICEDAGRGWLLGSNFIDIGAVGLTLSGYEPPKHHVLVHITSSL